MRDRPSTRGHQPVADGVRLAHGVLLVRERSDRHHRTEDLFLGDPHLLVDACEDGRGIEGALPVRRLPARDDLRPVLAPGLDVAVHLVTVLRGDERPDLRLGLERIADLEAVGRVGEGGDEILVERVLDEHARAGLAALAGGVVDRPDRARNGIRQVRVGEHEVRALPAELEREPLDGVGR